MKKLIYLLLIIAVALPLNACGGGGGDGSTDVPLESEYSELYEPLFTGTVEGHTEWNYPGLRNKDGSVYNLLKRNVAKKTLNVTDFGAKKDDPDFDNTDAFDAALEQAGKSPGTEVYVPNGRYYFVSNILGGNAYQAHISLRGGTNLRGESKEGTILVSSFFENNNEKNQTTAIIAFGVSNCVISDLTVTSDTDDLPDPNDSRNNTSNYVGPKYGITVDVNTSQIGAPPTTNIVIDNVIVEKYQRMGVRISRSRNVIVENSLFRNALSLGGGGYGYGVTIQGLLSDSQPVDQTDSNWDTLWNVVRNNVIEGPYMRHGVIVQYYAHNNLITNNHFKDILLDSIDLHGEREYSNEVSFNLVERTRAGYACGIGNSGATHSSSGRNNFIFKNIFDDNQGGINVILGSVQPILVENEITNVFGVRANGINIEHGPRTKMYGNKIDTVTGTSSYGIRILYSYEPLDPSANIPDGIEIIGNTIKNVRIGVYIEVHTENYKYEDNNISGFSESAYINGNDTFEVPPVSTAFNPVEGVVISSFQDAYVEKGQPDRIFNNDTKMKLKATYNPEEAGYQRVNYIDFNFLNAPVTYDKVYLRLTGRAQNALPTINMYAVAGWDWDEAEMTWNNTPFHHPDLGVVKDPTTNEIYDDEDPNTTIVEFYDFEFVTSDYTAMRTYYVEVTAEFNALRANPAFADVNQFSLVLANDEVSEVYCEIMRKSRTNANSSEAPAFIFV